VIPTGAKDPTDVVGRRIVAFVLDAILITAIVVIVGALVARRYTNAPSNACETLREQTPNTRCVQLGSHVYSVSSSRMGLVYFAGLAATFLDFVILPGVTGASIAKLMLGLRVVDAGGTICGFGKALGRTVLLVVDLFFLIGLFVMLGSKPHKRIGDNAAGTYVVDLTSVGTPVINFAPPVPRYAYAEQPAWGAPQQPPPPAWGAPQQPQQPAWGAPPAPPPVWGMPQQPQASPPPPPPPAPAPEVAPPAPPPVPEPDAAKSGESWWDSALGDDEPSQ
jgi:uncharacterized RDD family membrane protein YckC